MKYTPILGVKETEVAIKLAKDTFERELAAALHLTRVSAPLFVCASSGLNDNLSGEERPVAFDIKESSDTAEIVHSLAKWKRMALARYGFENGEGLYTDMDAIRRDEETDYLHSIYVDQWDWEVVISREQRTLETLKDAVRRIYRAFLNTHARLVDAFPQLRNGGLPGDITFITAEELYRKYPGMTAKERENAIARETGACFVIGIGAPLSGGEAHDGRAPDYDDWSLNGDILLYYDVLERAVELSSMGIRVDSAAMLAQLKAAGCEERLKYPFHQAVINDALPLTIGGGIGQSRICMLLLRKLHLGEVQASIWPENKARAWESEGIVLL